MNMTWGKTLLGTWFFIFGVQGIPLANHSWLFFERHKNSLKDALKNCWAWPNWPGDGMKGFFIKSVLNNPQSFLEWAHFFYSLYTWWYNGKLYMHIFILYTVPIHPSNPTSLHSCLSACISYTNPTQNNEIPVNLLSYHFSMVTHGYHHLPAPRTYTTTQTEVGPLECAVQVIAVHSQLNKEWHIRKKRDKFGHSGIKEQFSALLESGLFVFHSPFSHYCKCVV